MSRREQPRMMARPISRESDGFAPRQAVGPIAVMGALALVAAITLSTFLGGGGDGEGASHSPGGAAAIVPSQGPLRTVGGGGQGAGAGRTPRPTGASGSTPTQRQTERPPRATPTLEPTADPQPTPGDGRAPTSPAEFDLRGQVIDIGFPLRADTNYQYRDNFLDVRTGAPDDYNHSRARDGEVERLHDGIDIYAAIGQPLLAPFSGVVIDPRSRWQPWERQRYGQTVVIVSDEPTSEGYVALFAHAADVWVEIGQHVTRGQVVGTLGRTGNAEDQSFKPHVHFELRAPFLIDWTPLGEAHAIDAFNPYPSLAEADPN